MDVGWFLSVFAYIERAIDKQFNDLLSRIV